MSFADARVWLEDKQPEAALVCLLDAWREHKRHPAIADAIDLLSASLMEKQQPIRAVGGTSAKAAWQAAADSKSPLVLGRLLEAIPDSTDRYHQLDVLLSMPADPRMATAAKKWLEEHTVKATSRAPFYDRVIALIDKTSDVRLVPFLKAITSPENRTTAIRLFGLQTWTPLVETAERLAKKKVRDLDRDDVHTLAAIAKLLRTPAKSGSTADAEELFARIYADPTDDGSRAVLADLLQQQGDPRGEFIAMQLARHGTNKPRSSAERKLEQTWGRTWLGPLDPILQKQGVVFERGFLARARYAGGSTKAIDAREWSTVTHLDVSAASQWEIGSTPLLWSPAVRNLRHVTGINPLLDLSRMREREQPMPWETVGFIAPHWTYQALVNDEVAALFPAARSLRVRAQADDTFYVNADEILALLEKWPLIEDLEIDAVPDLVFGIRGYSRGRDLKRLLLDGPMGVLTIEDTHLDFETRFCNDDVTNLLADMVRRLGLRHVTLRGAKKPLVKGDYFFQEYMRMSLVPLREATRAANAGLTIQGE